ncbi:MAG: Holliday junction branch migration protein RuvA [Deltaproteobacteria bacterium]|nr:Holliday junction branch migration protein RuvA [Deltaproteobacteria bacterium]
MIARLRGRLLEKAPEQIIVDVGGVGYQLAVSLQSFARLPALGDEVDLRVHTHVREDALQLFGFLDEEERALFLLLIQVATIGPRVAMAVLSGLDAAELEHALADGDARRLTAIPGIGKKKADLIVLQLREKVRALQTVRRIDPGTRIAGDGAEAISALVNLGYKPQEAERAVQSAEQAGSAPLPELIREALRRLAS